MPWFRRRDALISFIPACLRTRMLHRLHEEDNRQFAMKSLATLYIWWTKIYREIQFHWENCIEYVKIGKDRKHDDYQLVRWVTVNRSFWDNPLGQGQTSENADTVQANLNMSMETITDDDSSDLILLTDLKPPTQESPVLAQELQLKNQLKLSKTNHERMTWSSIWIRIFLRPRPTRKPGTEASSNLWYHPLSY